MNWVSPYFARKYSTRNRKLEKFQANNLLHMQHLVKAGYIRNIIDFYFLHVYMYAISLSLSLSSTYTHVHTLGDDIEAIRLVFHVKMPPHNADCVQMFNLFRTRKGGTQRPLMPINRRWVCGRERESNVKYNNITIPMAKQSIPGPTHWSEWNERTNEWTNSSLLYSKI